MYVIISPLLHFPNILHTPFTETVETLKSIRSPFSFFSSLVIDLSKYFTKIYVSSIYDDKKDRGTFFDYPIKDFNIKDGEALFIDDNESLLTIGKSKGLKVKQMDREHIVTTSKHEIIHNLKNI